MLETVGKQIIYYYYNSFFFFISKNRIIIITRCPCFFSVGSCERPAVLCDRHQGATRPLPARGHLGRHARLGMSCDLLDMCCCRSCVTRVFTTVL